MLHQCRIHLRRPFLSHSLFACDNAADHTFPKAVGRQTRGLAARARCDKKAVAFSVVLTQGVFQKANSRLYKTLPLRGN